MGQVYGPRYRGLFLKKGLIGEKNTEKSKIDTTAVKAGGLASAAFERAVIKKDSATIAEKRMKDWEDMVAKTPSYTDLQGTLIYNKAEVDPSFVGGNAAMMLRLYLCPILIMNLKEMCFI